MQTIFEDTKDISTFADCKKKVALEMIIKSAVCFVKTDEELRVKWERGTKSIQTKKRA
jgi:hypothetical protein